MINLTSEKLPANISDFFNWLDTCNSILFVSILRVFEYKHLEEDKGSSIRGHISVFHQVGLGKVTD